MSNPTLFHLLHLEDSRVDARLVEVHLRAAFPDVDLVVAGDRTTYEEALRGGGDWDLVLADYVVPGFSGLDALRLARERYPTIPFIVVTGAIGEEAAAEILREGATDFLLKTRLGRLASVIQRAIKERGEVQEHQAALERNRLQEETYRATFENSLLVAWLVDPTTGIIREANEASASFYGYPREAFRGMPLENLTCLDATSRRANLDRLLKGETLRFETKHRLKSGEIRDMEIFTTPLAHLGTPLAYAVCYDITAKKEAEARFKGITARFDDAQRMAHMGDWVLDLNTFAITVSENLGRIYGLDPADYPGDFQGFLALVHPEDRQAFEAHYQAFLEGREFQKKYDFRILRPDGSIRHIHGYTELVRDAEGRPRFVKGTNLDITERVEAEQERDTLLKHLTNLRMALDEAAIWAITDRKGIITHANDLFSKISGYSLEELLGQNHRILKSGRHPDAFYADMWHTISQSHIWRGVVCNKAKDGHFYWVDTTIVPFVDDRGRPVEYLAIRFEITAQKDAEETLARVAEERRGLLEANSVAKAVPFSEQVDGTLRFGPTALWVLGLGPTACPGVPRELRSLLDPGYLGDFEEALAHAGQGHPRSFEASFIKGEEKLWTRWTLALAEGRLMGVIQDITEIHRFQEQLLQNQKLESLGTLVGGISHDFNNLLMAILGHVEILQRKSPGPEHLAQTLDTIHKAASRGKGMVAELMHFSRRHAPTRTPTDLNLLLEEVHHLLALALPPCIYLRLNLEPGLPLISVDSNQIHQLVMNLAINARDSIDGEGLITLRSGRAKVEVEEAEALGKRSGPYLFIGVEDTGSGMPPEVAARIYEPFYTTKPEGKGTGLGLSVVHGIVESHGGLLRCQSELGLGTRFSVLLPLVLDKEGESSLGERA